jgi:hypothetical protein
MDSLFFKHKNWQKDPSIGWFSVKIFVFKGIRVIPVKTNKKTNNNKVTFKNNDQYQKIV